jgi:tetratricopeptide (TPR) repeat protein
MATRQYWALAVLALLFGVSLYVTRPTSPGDVFRGTGGSFAAAEENGGFGRGFVRGDPKTEAALRARLADAERRALILDARSEIEDAAYARLEVILAGFGALITILVVGFGIATYRTAANAARAELANIKDRVEALQREAETATGKSVEAAKSADKSAESAKASAEQAHSHELSAQQDSAKIKEVAALAERQVRSSGSDAPTELSPAERETVADAAREVGDKPEGTWTADDFRVRMLAASDAGEWSEVLRLGRAMEFLHGNEPESLAFALFEQALSLKQLKNFDDAFKTYKGLVDRLGDSKLGTVRRLVAMGLSNMAINLGDLGRYEEAVSVADEALRRFGEDDDAGLQLSIAKAMLTKGFSLGRLGKREEAIENNNLLAEKFGESSDPEVLTEVALALVNKGGELAALGRRADAITVFDSVMAKFEGSEEPSVQKWVTYAAYSKACSLALMNKVTATIDALEDWKARTGTFDCDTIENDPDFDEIRDRPAFARYMRKQGCAPTGAPVSEAPAVRPDEPSPAPAKPEPS